MRVLTLSRNKTHDKLLRKCHFSNYQSAKEPTQGIPCAGPLLYSPDCLAKHLTQQDCHPLRGLDGGDHQQVAIHLRPVEVMSRAADKLRQERPLGAPVAIAEGMQVVGRTVKVGELLHEGVMRQAFEVILLFQPVKNQLGLRFDLPSRAEIRSLLAEVHRTDLPRPIVQVREKELMDRLVVGKIKNAFQRALFQLGGVDIGGESLRLLQRGLVMDMQFVHQHRCAGVAVVLNGIDAVRHIIVTFRLVWKNAAAAPLWSPRHAAHAGTAPASEASPDIPPCGRRPPRSSWEVYIVCRCSCT